MDLKSLIATGLTKPQAEAYALLIELGEVKPAIAATRLKITRTNAYKVLDKLVELGLASKGEEGKTLAYSATNPIALRHFVTEFTSAQPLRYASLRGWPRPCRSWAAEAAPRPPPAVAAAPGAH